MRCSAEVCTISGGSAGCFFQLRKEIQPFILFDGHFLLHVCCSHSIPWRGRIFKSIDKHSKWFSMQEMGFSSYIYCPTACGGKVVPQAPKGDGPFGARGQWWRLRRKLRKKGRGLRCRLCRKVVFASLRGRKGKIQRVWQRLRRSFWPPFGGQFCIVSFRLAAFPLPPLTRSPSPIDGGGKISAMRGPFPITGKAGFRKTHKKRSPLGGASFYLRRD
jgi:hypothetical protein